jgi:hypothetical protein
MSSSTFADRAVLAANAGSGRVVVAEADGPSGASLPGSARAPDVAGRCVAIVGADVVVLT